MTLVAQVSSCGTDQPSRPRKKEGLVRTEWRQQVGKPNRRYYSITPRGRKALAAGRDSFEAHVAAMRSVLGFSA